jgi:hypothetical protein
MPKLNIKIDMNYDINFLLNLILQAQEKYKSPIKSILSIFLTTIIWNIWCERNIRVFKGLEQPFRLRTKQILIDSKTLIHRRFQDYNLIEKEKLIIMNYDPELGILDCFRPP